MDDQRWKRLQQLFHDALDLPPAEREAFLADAESDPALRAEVLTLLAADAEPGTLGPLPAGRIAGPSEPDDAWEAPSMEGRRIGPYHVLRRLGQGGMGAVYLAEREDVSSQVALKLVRGALGAPELVQRFLQERRLLARLAHPRIARLLDAGIAEDETPYFAMEYVAGSPITEHCRAHALPAEARLRLFRDVCDAVGYAHSNLIVHRDIKPSNVLVTGDGEVKLLDFGIAKLVGEDDAGLTRTGMRVMSPAYAAPEQLAGEPVTTATDVYALGVLLHEILTGARPGSEPHGRLAGDLAAIAQRAAASEPERRYRTAEQLRDDITRHLSGLPVDARPPTFGYRAGKFLRRHAAAVAVGAVVALSLGGGLGAALWQGQRAEHARAEAETALSRSVTVTAFLTDLFRAADPREARGEEVTAVQLVERGVERIGGLDDDPPLQAELLQTLAGVNLELGRYAEAAGLMERAVAVRRGLPAGEPLISALNVWGWSLDRLGLPDSAAAAWSEALERGTPLLGEGHETVMAARGNLAVAYGRLGRDAEAEALLREVVEIDRRTRDPDDPDRAPTLNNLGIQLTHQGHYVEAEAMLREALRIRLATVGEDHPWTGMAMDNLGMTLREAGNYDDAEPLLRRGLEIRRAVLGDGHRFFGESLFALGTLLALRAGPGDLEEADALLHRGLDIYVETLGADHPGTAYLLHSLGILERSRGDLDAAAERFRQALVIRRPARRDNPMVTVTSLAALAAVLRLQGSPEAVPLAREAVALAEARIAADHPERANAEIELALALVTSGESALAALPGTETREAEAPGPETPRDRFARAVARLAAVIGTAHPRVLEACAEGQAAGLVTGVMACSSPG
jgi:eukaryotic-like serine/threonine-protein kinase